MKLLKKLYQISSPSGGETSMRKYVADYCKKNKATISFDKAGNVYVTKGQADVYPCVVAHLDEVHRNKPESFSVIEQNGIILGVDSKKMEHVGIGADDKNGIWVALKCLESFDNIKLAFFVQEEIGCVGSRQADMSFFNDCSMVIECDRRNGYDFITSIGSTELCDKDFFNRCGASEFGYKVTSGLTTDVGTLKENGLKVCAVNLSCGYYNPHTKDEMTKFSELDNCLNLVKHIVENIGGTVQSHVHKAKKCYHLFDDFTGLDTHYWERKSNQSVLRKSTISNVEKRLIVADLERLLGFDLKLEDIIVYLQYKYQNNFTDDEVEKIVFNNV